MMPNECRPTPGVRPDCFRKPLARRGCTYICVSSQTMKPHVALALLSVALVGCSQKTPPTAAPPVALPERLQSRFEDYCDYTGSLGIGFVAWHTYDYRFRQSLKRTHDPELKRLYVLENLHRDTELALDDLGKGIIRTGKTSSRPLTASEWQAARQRILEQIEETARPCGFSSFHAWSQLLDCLASPSQPMTRAAPFRCCWQFRGALLGWAVSRLLSRWW